MLAGIFGLLIATTTVKAAPTNTTDFDDVSAIVKSALSPLNAADTNRTDSLWLKDARTVGDADGSFTVSAAADLNDHVPATFRIVSVDVAGQIAAVRVEAANLDGHPFTEFFALIKQAGAWRIAGAVRSSIAAKEDDFSSGLDVQKTLHAYSESFRTGNGLALRPIWFEHARVTGSVHGQPVNRDPDGFCRLVTEVQAQPDFESVNVAVMQAGRAACARVEIKDWKGVRYTDFLLLFKQGGEFKISQKVFDAHGDR